ncbi:alpha/beta hydrolase family protein [Sulfuracidifex tepidarius]|uniref:alpha/beta hydrolase family protein n=1 Tax=Sulfuracidifex tepidarius TaxID=1294262 RepID=UPI000A9F0C4C|nr:S9 family peptidase [Sulfuracidifex tepidarius]
MDPKVFYSIKLISNPVKSEDGTFFQLNWIDFTSNSYSSSIYFKGKDVKRVTWGGKESQPLVKDGVLHYVKGGDKDTLMRSTLGEPEPVFSFDKIKKYLPYGKGFLFLGEERKGNSTPFEASSLKYKFDSRGLLRSRTSLYYFDGKETRTIMGGNYDVNDFDTDGRRVVASATMSNDDVSFQDVFEVDVGSSSFTKLTKGEGAVTAVALTKSGFAYLGHRKGLSPWARKDVIFEDGRVLTCGKYCGNSVVNDLFVKYGDKLVVDGGKVYSLGQDGPTVNVYSVEDGEKVTDVKGVVLDFDVKDGVEYVYSDPRKPSLMGGYDPNESVEGVIPDSFTKGIEGWVMKRDEKAPNVVFVHGGPHTAYGYMYYIEFNYLFQEGFNVIYTNPSGSQGYGEDFARAVVGKWCDIDFSELMSFVSSLGLKGKFHLTGGSYGGYFTNMALTKTDFFSSGIAERSISNLVSMCGTSDIGFWFNAIESGISDPWERESIGKLLEMSPIYHVKKVKTPLMLIHGEEDMRCPIEQAEQFFIALKMNGVDARLVRYPGDSHEHARRGKPLNMVDS